MPSGLVLLGVIAERPQNTQQAARAKTQLVLLRVTKSSSSAQLDHSEGAMPRHLTPHRRKEWPLPFSGPRSKPKAPRCPAWHWRRRSKAPAPKDAEAQDETQRAAGI